MNKNPYIRPFLKWAGGKGQLKDELKKHIPSKISTYYEPFVGAGALLFDTKYENVVINDMNKDLMTTYRVIKDNLDELIPLLKDYASKNNSVCYYKIRSIDREENYAYMSEIKKAARFIYLNKTCYNGLYRVNSNGLFNTPFGRYKNPAICNERVLIAVSKYLNECNITIENGDFKKSVEKCKKGDFVYFDPPYHSLEKTNFTGYQSGGFDESEQERLFRVFKDLTKKDVKCMLSNSSTSFIKDLYNEFVDSTYVVKATRAINSDPDGRGLTDEVIITNWVCTNEHY